MNFPDQYHAAAVWQAHLMDERNQRHLAALVARRQRRRERGRMLRGLLTLAFGRRARRSSRDSARGSSRTRPVGCAV